MELSRAIGGIDGLGEREDFPSGTTQTKAKWSKEHVVIKVCCPAGQGPRFSHTSLGSPSFLVPKPPYNQGRPRPDFSHLRDHNPGSSSQRMAKILHFSVDTCRFYFSSRLSLCLRERRAPAACRVLPTSPRSGSKVTPSRKPTRPKGHHVLLPIVSLSPEALLPARLIWLRPFPTPGSLLPARQHAPQDRHPSRCSE